MFRQSISSALKHLFSMLEIAMSTTEALVTKIVWHTAGRNLFTALLKLFENMITAVTEITQGNTETITLQRASLQLPVMTHTLNDRD